MSFDVIKNIVLENMLKLSCLDWLYICAISLQLAGALILIIYFFRNTKIMVKRLYAQEESGLGISEKGMVTFRAKKLRKCAQQVFINRISFIYIFLGYCVGIYGEIIVEDKNLILIFSILVCFILIALGKCVAILLAIIFYRKDEKVTYERAKKETGSDVNVVEF